MARKPKLDVLIWKPEMMLDKSRKQVIIAAELIEPGPDGQLRPSGNAIHLGMTAADAMRLASLLRLAQQQLGLPDDPDQPTWIPSPPEKDRH
jgi:hypothetical protein